MKDYSISEKVMLRTHRNAFNELSLFNENGIELFLNQTYIQDAIYIASVDLYEKIKKIHSQEIKEKERILYSLTRYINRMSTRCSPFGLFAGCAIGVIGECTNLIVSQKIVRHTRLDMNYLCVLAQHLSDLPEIKYKLKYYPNNSLYKLGNEFRYIEYNYFKDKRVHRISSVKRTSYLDKILQKSKKGILIKDLYPYITNDYINNKDALNYIQSLIQSQILISELDPTVTGDDFLTHIICILNKIDAKDQNNNVLKYIQNTMKELDLYDNNVFEKYKAIENAIQNIGAIYSRKHLFQVDINNVFINNTISVSIRNEIDSTITFLKKISVSHGHEYLLKFKEKFINRFEENEVPLLIALDPEIGIGYPVENKNKNVSSLLDDFKLPENNYHSQSETYGRIQSILLKKISECNNSPIEIEIYDADFKDIKEDEINLPNTFTVFIEIIKDNGKDTLIRLKSIGHSSGANLLARFAYTDKKIEDFIKEIIQKEQSLVPSAILAEVAHLPDSRVGNILYRPHLRDYEIAYLANSSMQEDKIIYASDLMLSVKHNRLILRSKNLSKEIMPHLTNAHNYSLSTIPIYRFLCDMQYQNTSTSLIFEIPFLLSELSYIPRIRYKHTILFRATWNINIDEIKHILQIKEDKQFLYNINVWRKRKKIPDYSLLSDGDNELFIDWNNVINLRAFLSIIKNRSNFRLIEFMYDENDAVIRDENGNGYLNECVFTLYKNKDV